MAIEQPVINIWSQVVSMRGRLTTVYHVQVVRGKNSRHDEFTDTKQLEAYLRGIRSAFILAGMGDIVTPDYVALSLE